MIDASIAKALCINKQTEIKRKLLSDIYKDKELAPLFEWITDRIYFDISQGNIYVNLNLVEMYEQFPFTKVTADWVLLLQKLGYKVAFISDENLCVLSWSDD
jgi:hypothetical protein